MIANSHSCLCCAVAQSLRCLFCCHRHPLLPLADFQHVGCKSALLQCCDKVSRPILGLVHCGLKRCYPAFVCFLTKCVPLLVLPQVLHLFKFVFEAHYVGQRRQPPFNRRSTRLFKRSSELQPTLQRRRKKTRMSVVGFERKRDTFETKQRSYLASQPRLRCSR